jgi:hypothetical protein
VVAPLRVARGVQNKVLEAFALAKPVIATSAAFDALELPPEIATWSADEAAGLAGLCVRALREGCGDAGAAARSFVMRRYPWPDKARTIEALLEGGRRDAVCDAPSVVRA